MNPAKYFFIPKIKKEFIKVFWRNYLFFKKTWMISLFWVVIEPSIVLVAVGLGLGSFVNNIDDMSYIDFFFPSVLASTAMIISFFEATHGTYHKIVDRKVYSMMSLTRIGVHEIIFGEILWCTTKGLIGVLGVILVAFAFGIVVSSHVLIVVPILFLVSLIFSSLGLIISSRAKNYNLFTYLTSGLIVPMTLLCGTYFPVKLLPLGLQQLIYLMPLTHGVLATRAILNHSVQWVTWLNVFILCIFALLLMSGAFRQMSRRLSV